MFSDVQLSRVEDAGINASAPPEQRWLDGWLVRFSPGKAKRARCINALAEGRLTLDARLHLAGQVFAAAGLPMLVRITRFSRPAGLEDELARRGYTSFDDTRVMVRRQPFGPTAPQLPPEAEWDELGADDFAAAVGALRGSPAEQIAAHARRLALSPVPYRGHVIRRRADRNVLACGQFAVEGQLVGLYDVFTAPAVRGQGLAHLLCERLLSAAAAQGASVAYLQVEADNAPARRIYRRLGFVDAYAYHYRQAPVDAV